MGSCWLSALVVAVASVVEGMAADASVEDPVFALCQIVISLGITFDMIKS